MRIQKIYIPGQGETPTQFYNDYKYSTWVLATGNTGFNPFSAVEPETLRNYKIGQNLFDQNQGRILLIKGSFHGANYARFDLGARSAALSDIANAMNALIEQGRLTITQDSQITHKDLLSNLFPRIPLASSADSNGVLPANSVVPNIPANVYDGGLVKTADKLGYYFSPPLFIASGRNVSFAVNFPTGYSVPTVLNNYILKFELSVEEIPQSNMTEIRN
ncbi:hypothetical protein [Leptospira interrogans]|uniref:hypothetical protein n=1 Tax=Leptospira interrogans TaxID=173 RepID=UPI0007734730|nr:hypothetical protein [Leptospira interrogans]